LQSCGMALEVEPCSEHATTPLRFSWLGHARLSSKAWVQTQR